MAMSRKHPNILFVLIDCARSDKWVGSGRTTVTPNLDRLCSQGILFPTTIAEKSFTTPALSSLLTGLYSPKHGVHLVWGYRLPDHVPLLTHELAERGYHTYAEVTGPLLPEMGLDRAFEHYEYRAPCDCLHTAWGDRFVERLRGDYYQEPWFLMLHLFELHEPRHVSVEYDRPELGHNRYERAISSLDAQLVRVFDAAGDESLLIVTGDHGEKTRAEIIQNGTAVAYAWNHLLLNETKGMPLYKLAYWAGPGVVHQIYSQMTPLIQDIRIRDVRRKLSYGWWDRLIDKIRLLWLMPRIHLSDLTALGVPLKLTAMLKRRGLLDKGQSKNKVERLTKLFGKDKLLNMQMRMWLNAYKNNIAEGHGIHVYDYLVRVPLVMRWPQHLPTGVVYDRMIRQPDILPTILDLIGINPNQFSDIDGRSFKPLIEGKPWQSLPAYVSVTGIPADLELRGVRTEEYKYTFGPKNPELPEELYDLGRDPKETQNIAPAEPELCNELRELANSFIPIEGERQAEQITVDAIQQKQIEKHLKQLGYID